MKVSGLGSIDGKSPDPGEITFLNRLGFGAHLGFLNFLL